ncbi:MAG: RNA polymerase sigma-70 factor [Bacteroidales bacterium]|nr:RNA polymerase sigma-70 factor [Bacteroidales bacterium]MBQ5549763.1 RNA polymerase sigma-70 factor [Bacteroidales bacterium]MBQ5576870.1 RNA polymerase sigma-70 factor [Bacteroidales bacterium]
MGIDTKTFETLFKQNFVAVTAYCNKYVRDTEEAKDLAHRAFMKVWEKREAVPEGSNVKALTYRIAHNLSINYIRDHKKFCDEEELQTVESENSDADNDIKAAELEAAVIDTINHMPEKSKKVFLMSRYDQLSYNDIAGQLGVSIKTVEAHISAALKLLRKKIFGKE